MPIRVSRGQFWTVCPMYTLTCPGTVELSICQVGMFMRIFLVFAALGSYTASVAPVATLSGRVKNPALVRRDSIIRSVFADHPTWTSLEVFNAVQPLLHAAGLKPVGFQVLRNFLTSLRKEQHVSFPRPKLNHEHLAFLKAEFARDPDQSRQNVCAKFDDRFGPDAVPASRIARWWARSGNGYKYMRNNDGVAMRLPIAPKNPTPLTREMDEFIRQRSTRSVNGSGFRDTYHGFVVKFGPNAADRATVQATWWAHRDALTAAATNYLDEHHPSSDDSSVANASSKTGQ